MLELKDVSVIFNEGTVNEKVALSDINLKLNTGDFVTIIGSNGAGKSTLFQAISGADVYKRQIPINPINTYIKTAKPPNLEPNKIPDSKTNKNCKVK